MHAFSALSDPTRRQIVELLADGERTAGEIVRRFEVSAPAISQHLKVLKAARLVTARADAQRRVYRLAPEGLDEIDEWLGEVRRFWNDRLDALRRELERDDNEGGNA